MAVRSDGLSWLFPALLHGLRGTWLTRFELHILDLLASHSLQSSPSRVVAVLQIPSDSFRPRTSFCCLSAQYTLTASAIPLNFIAVFIVLSKDFIGMIDILSYRQQDHSL